MLQPTAAYRRLAQEWPVVRPIAALRRPALAALVAGAAVGITATGRITAPLLVSTTLYWSFAVAWQVAVAMMTTAATKAPLTATQRLDLFFAGNAPWSLWMLTVAAWSRLFPAQTDLYVILCTAAVPAMWTWGIVYGFCTGALGLAPRTALLRTVCHQGLIWMFAFVYIAWAVALWARASVMFAR
jgi:hypothetical protein